MFDVFVAAHSERSKKRLWHVAAAYQEMRYEIISQCCTHDEKVMTRKCALTKTKISASTQTMLEMFI